MKTTKKAKKLLIPTLILTLAVSVYFAQRSVTTADPSKGLDNQCEFVNLTCSISHEKSMVTATFDSIPEAEESITVNFSLPISQQVESVWIEGVNMYMGKVPVLVEQQESGEWRGWFMLGACSEPVMRWKMLVHIKGMTQPYVLFFETKMP